MSKYLEAMERLNIDQTSKKHLKAMYKTLGHDSLYTEMVYACEAEGLVDLHEEILDEMHTKDWILSH